MLSPGVTKVDDEDKLDQDEQEGSGQAEVHPSRAEASVRDEERADGACQQDQDLQAPESVLEVRSRVSGALDADQQDGHQEEEEGDDEADPVDGQIPDEVGAGQLQDCRSQLQREGGHLAL